MRKYLIPILMCLCFIAILNADGPLNFPGVSNGSGGNGVADGTGNWTASASSSSYVMGSVGVGTSAPSSNLGIVVPAGPAGNTGGLQVDSDNSSGSVLRLKNSADGLTVGHYGSNFITSFALWSVLSPGTNDHGIWFSNVGGDVVISTNGKVGIGTTIPQFLLDVVGAGNFSGALTAQSLGTTGTGESFGVVKTTETAMRFEVNASTPATLYTSTAAVALRIVWDFSGPDVVMGASTNTVVSVATAAFNGFARMDPSISSGPTNGVLFKWRAPDHFNTAQDLILKDFTHYLNGTDTAVSTYTIAINAYASSAEKPTSFLLPITFNTLADGSGAQFDNEFASDVTLTGWAAAITPGAQYWIYVGRNGGDPSTVDTFCCELHIAGIRSPTQ